MGESQNNYVDLPRWLWALIGFVIGTAVISVLILSSDPFERLEGGAIFGGPIGAVLGWLFGKYHVRTK